MAKPEIIIATERFAQDPDGRQFVDFINENFKELDLSNSVIYYDFPSYADYESILHKPDFMIVSPIHGIVAIRFVTQNDLFRKGANLVEEVDTSLDSFCSILIGRLLKSARLKAKRALLKFDVTPILFCDENGMDDYSPECEIAQSYDSFRFSLEAIDKSNLSDEDFSEIRSIVEGAKALAKPQKRTISDPRQEKYAAALSELEAGIANFDQKQRITALSLVQGPQRIRGLAGSGKTIILAMKAAHIHLTHPDAKILVTFYTKSLSTLLRNLISRFYRHYKDEDPDWEKVQVRHGWGGKRVPGAYTDACHRANLMPMSLSAARNGADIHQDPFDFACRDLIQKDLVTPYYDYILIDEGQDFPSGFYELTFFMAKGTRDKKSIIWAYDELQNILNVKIRTPKELFGDDADGNPRIDLERAHAFLPEGTTNDIILSKCYRNQREVLLVAHSIGFGFKGPNIVQMLEDADHWRYVGYEVEPEEYTVGDQVQALRPEENSPLALPTVENEKTIDTYVAQNFDQELQWICSEVQKFLNGGLKPEDIMIIALDDRNAKAYFRAISSRLFELGINCNNIIADPYSEPPFTIENMVTLTTVYRAKGNESAVVIACGIDHMGRKSISYRNRLFAALTRTKAWLRVSGIGKRAQEFSEEINKTLAEFPILKFQVPHPDDIATIQNDLSDRAKKLRQIRESYINEMKAEGFSDDEILAALTAMQVKDE
ncbi:ATP-binding domain-containing protein [Terasakiella sp. A23]|uniref:DEAD/DEAH box helicase n=1 Tax=Terasakiella sp. FCG-A23 TaxID=3080561 RepID=UPI002953DE11|nr:ATP-binding domain-containing protein [Terasakiella sp. A23]MDV7341507.1 ATP-binding domain-containing protein [Terasakiella sp. A23]